MFWEDGNFCLFGLVSLASRSAEIRGAFGLSPKPKPPHMSLVWISIRGLRPPIPPKIYLS